MTKKRLSAYEIARLERLGRDAPAADFQRLLDDLRAYRGTLSAIGEWGEYLTADQMRAFAFAALEGQEELRAVIDRVMPPPLKAVR